MRSSQASSLPSPNTHQTSPSARLRPMGRYLFRYNAPMRSLRHFRQRQRLTQAELARAAGTSQSAIASYEAGHKSPTMTTVQRIANALGHDALIAWTPRLTREDRRSLALHHAIARLLEEDPDRSLARAHQVLALMRSRNPHASALLDEWELILRRPIEAIVEVMGDPRPWARELRQVTPFAGLLSAAQRTAVLRDFQATEGAGEAGAGR